MRIWWWIVLVLVLATAFGVGWWRMGVGRDKIRVLGVDPSQLEMADKSDLEQFTRLVTGNGKAENLAVNFHYFIPGPEVDMPVSLKGTERMADKSGVGVGCGQPDGKKMDFFVTPAKLADKLGREEARKKIDLVFKRCLGWHLSFQKLDPKEFDSLFAKIIGDLGDRMLVDLNL